MLPDRHGGRLLGKAATRTGPMPARLAALLTGEDYETALLDGEPPFVPGIVLSVPDGDGTVPRCPVHQEPAGGGRVCIACDGGVF
jgi:hypothetical protein